MKMKKFPVQTLILALLLLFMPAMVVKAAERVVLTGSGSASSPYVITSISATNSQVDLPKLNSQDSYTYIKVPFNKDCIYQFCYLSPLSGLIPDVEFKDPFNQKWYSYSEKYGNGNDPSIYIPEGAQIIFRIPNARFSGTGNNFYIHTQLPETQTASTTAQNLPIGAIVKKEILSGKSAKFVVEVDHPCYLLLYFHNSISNKYTAMPSGTSYYDGWTRTITASDYNSSLSASAVWIKRSGTYTFTVPYESGSSKFSFYIMTQEFNYGTLKVNWSNSHSDFTVTLTPGSNPDGATARLSDWSWPYDSSHNHGNLSGTTGSGHIDHSFDNVGYALLRIRLSGQNGDVSKDFYPSTLSLPPAAPTASLSNVTRTGAIINLSLVNKASHGDKLAVQKLVGGAWQTIQTVPITSGLSRINLSGLKAKTSYTIRVVGMKDAANGYPALTGSGSNFTFKTGLTTKPAVKSVKVSKVKVTKVPRKFIMGHYIGSGSNRRYLPGYYVGGYVTTSYKVTVTLKTPARGSKGLWIDGVFVKGSGKKFTASLSMKAKYSMKGKKKKITICSAMDKNYGGLSPSVTKKVKIK